MRQIYKYSILFASLAIYAWFVGWYVFVLLFLATIVIASCNLPKKLNLWIPIICLIAGFVAMKYLYSSATIKLPIGYSVFAFSCISFLVDFSRKGDKNKENALDILCYLFFFPKMLCGPIVRFYPFQEQLNTATKPTKSKLYQAFKIGVFAAFCKFCVADNLAWAVSTPTYGLNSLFSSIVFALQLYLDFYAYSNFAIAFALLLGIDLPISFNSPYRAATFRDFWHRWNITVSEWLKDYIYIPLGGSRNVGNMRVKLNIIATFLVSGLWHGATLPFLLWGAIHGLLVIAERGLGSFVQRNRVIKLAYRSLVFIAVALLWQLFRLESMNDLLTYCGNMFSWASISLPLVLFLAGAGLAVWIVDCQAVKRLVFATSTDKHFIYREVTLTCLMLVLTILFYSQTTINFFYFKF